MAAVVAVLKTKAVTIPFESLSKHQIRTLEKMDRGFILAAWIANSEIYVALDCKAPNLFIWQKNAWNSI